uniref:Lactonase family protein n=1 Tax=Panagrellus redivivus TaxID=6233 RepID=A0A7E4VNY4_PANRE
MSAFFAIGRYTHPPHTAAPQKDGIHIVRLDLESGKLSTISRFDEAQNVSFFATAPGSDLLFAISELPNSVLNRFRLRWFDARSTETGKMESTPLLDLEARSEFDDAGACYISFTGNTAAIACYDSGVVRLFDTTDKMASKQRIKLLECTDELSERQEAPHAHCAVPWPGNPGVYAVADLGADRIYKITDGVSTPEVVLQVEPGVGPRLLLFHPDRPIAFLVAELSNELLVLDVDGTNALKIRQRVSLIGYPDSTVSDTTSTIQNAAHIALSKDGTRVIASNRGKINDIVIFTLSAENTVEFTGIVPAGGIFPRSFEVVEDKYIIVANQKSASLVVYAVNGPTPVAVSSLTMETPIAFQRLG